MSHTSRNYSRILRDAGYRVTDQREVILDAVCAGGGHSTLKEIFARAQNAIPSIDLSSVYRTLKLFVDVGLVVIGMTSDGEAVYEIPQDHPHHHLICQRCGAESEMTHDIIETLFATLKERYGFTTTSNHLVFFGICEHCAVA
jgi:Fur family transcriptional regulator, ferric uptake regulator